MEDEFEAVTLAHIEGNVLGPPRVRGRGRARARAGAGSRARARARVRARVRVSTSRGERRQQSKQLLRHR